MSDDEKASVQMLLESIWENYARPVDQLNHDLVVMAIPRYPSNIEAVAALDVTTLRLALRQFMHAREAADEKPSIRASGAQGEAEASPAGSGLQHELDARSDPAGASAQPADPTDEKGQGDPAAGAVEGVKRVNITLPEDVLAAIDAYIAKSGQTRSGFLRWAAELEMSGAEEAEQ